MLSVIAVNYNSSGLLRDCLASIKADIDGMSYEAIVVDSGSEEKEAQKLAELQSGNVRIILNKENIGYARAVNIGIEDSKGDCILITNPDVYYMQGSISAMMDALSELPGCGAVGPRTWWDKGKTFLLPFSELITPSRVLRAELMRASHFAMDITLNRWIKKSVNYWTSDRPLIQEMLSGACIMTTRKILNDVGGFDGSFPLYFEDTDWSLRVRRAGYRLYMVPNAEIAHYYNQSAGREAVNSQEKYARSFGIYMKKHFMSSHPFAMTARRALAKSHNKVSGIYEDIGVFDAPPVFSAAGLSKKLVLLSPLDTLMPSAGAFFDGDSFRIPDELWDKLGKRKYYAMALSLDSLGRCGMWHWEKG